MNKTKPTLPVYEFRPLPNYFNRHEFYRYNGGNWILDDGEYDLAFASPDDFVCLYVEMPYHYNIIWSWCKDGNWGGYEPKHPNGNAWHYMLREGATDWENDSWDRDAHPNEIAGRSSMDFVFKLKGCSNGRGVDFKPLDPHIKAGLLRIRDTKEIVRPPKQLICMYCHPKEEALQNKLLKKFCAHKGYEVGSKEYINALIDVKWFIKQFEAMGYYKNQE